LEAINKRYGRTGRGLKITNGQANGQNLWLWFGCVVKGAHRGGAGVERLSSLIWQPVTPRRALMELHVRCWQVEHRGIP
jgi:hypothetical protein